MKKIITILLFLPFLSLAQVFNGQFKSTFFSSLDWNVSITNKSISGIQVTVGFSEIQLSVSNGATFNYMGKSYFPSDLGYSSWPIKSKGTTNFDWSLYYKGTLIKKFTNEFGNRNFQVIRFQNSDPGNPPNSQNAILANGKKIYLRDFNINDLIVEVNRAYGGDLFVSDEVIKKIQAKSDKPKTNPKNPTASITPNTTRTTSSNNTVETPPSNFGNKSMQQLTKDRDDAVVNLVNTTAKTLNFFLSEARENKARREAAYQKKFDERLSFEKADAKNKLAKAKIYFSNALNSVSKEEMKNPETRMHLIFLNEIIKGKFSYYSTSTDKSYDVVEISFLIPNEEEWISDAISNHSDNAILYKYAKSLLIGNEDNLNKIKLIAEKGNIDAMLALAEHYNYKKNKSGFYGENPTEAMYWINKAAEKGCPRAFHYLGMIYKYGYTNEWLKDYIVRYNVKKDNLVSFDFFNKAENLFNYQPSAYGQFKMLTEYYEWRYNFNLEQSFEKDPGKGTSTFTPLTYEELAKFYKKGVVVPKSESRAEELLKLSLDHKNEIEKSWLSEEICYAGFNQFFHIWPIADNELVSTKIEGGKYIFELKNGGNSYSTIPILNLTGNFIISFKLKQTIGNNDNFYGLVLGRNSSNGYYHFIGNTINQQFVLADKGKIPKDIFNKKIPNLLKTDRLTDYIIRKIGNKISIFINGKLIIEEMEISNLYGNEFGFSLYAGNNPMKIEIEDFRFKTIY